MTQVMKTRPLVSIDEEMGIVYEDAGPWRGYHLTASGDTFEQCIDDATISEIDQDGGELNCYGINDAPTNQVSDVAYLMIRKLFEGKYLS